MKVRVSARQVRNSYPVIIEVGYCALWNLLTTIDPHFYTAGTYGWNADIYEVDPNTVIVTGYRPFGNYNGNKLADKYNKLAEEVNRKYNWTADYSKRVEELRNLLTLYVAEVTAK